MSTSKAKRLIEQLLSVAGISVNGNQPWDVQVHNTEFFTKALTDGSLAVGETYMDKWWDCFRLDEFFFRVLRNATENRLRRSWKVLTDIYISRLINPQSASRAFRSNASHYNLGNKFFASVLDSRMMYTCADWKDADTLDEAQENKLRLACLKLNLKPGMHILDIGCGWGGFSKFAAENYGVKVAGIAASAEQVAYARTVCRGLPVDIQLMDYRQLEGKFDRVISMGMFEHVGSGNYRTYMKIVHDCLKEDGLFLLHTIGANVTSTWTDPWLNEYIFPGSVLPSIKQIGKSIEGLFVMEDWQNISADYDRTLMAWHEKFVANWDNVKSHFNDKFYRMWNYYLLSCAGSFRARKNQLWQIVLSKHGVPGGYRALH